MKKVTILKGLPACGKTTYANNLLKKFPGRYKRIGKDFLRAMLDNSKWSRDNEKFILKARDLLILEALENGKNVIVDDTNFGKKHEEHIRNLVKGKATVEVKFFDENVDTCIKRDLERTRSVGKDVILRMYNDFIKTAPKVYEYFPHLSNAVIFDIDGTLAHMKDRSPFDWAKVGQDSLDLEVLDILDMERKSGKRIILLSGRDSVCRPETEKWLYDMGVVYDDLHMRPKDNTDSDVIIKRDFLNLVIKPKYNVLRVYDDRNCVVAMWRDEGVKCLQVQEGNF